jgi:hypothetical protein
VKRNQWGQGKEERKEPKRIDPRPRREHALRVAGCFAASVFVLFLHLGFAVPHLEAGEQAQKTTADSLSPEWTGLLQRMPYGFKPLPPEERSTLDGTYTKVDPKEDPRVPCRRCPDYAPEGGLWKLQWDRGVFRIFHASSGWKSIGSFVVAADRLSLFNDPVCHEITGAYTWTLQDHQLVLKVIEDECAIRLRATNLTKQPWLSCRPPNTEAAVTGHWLEPPGCQ